MTLDEQIAQLKPGDEVEVLATSTADYFKAFVLSRPTPKGWLVVAREPWITSITVSAVAVHVSRLRFPEPPPPPKAEPGKVYRRRRHMTFEDDNRTGLANGRLFDPIGTDRAPRVIDYDPNEWVLLDPQP